MRKSVVQPDSRLIVDKERLDQVEKTQSQQSQTPTQSIRLLLNPEEAAAALGVHRSRIWVLLGQKKLRGIKIGKARRFPISELTAFIDAEMAAQNGE